MVWSSTCYYLQDGVLFYGRWERTDTLQEFPPWLINIICIFDIYGLVVFSYSKK